MTGSRRYELGCAAPTGGAAGARSHTGRRREAADEIDGSAPWIGKVPIDFPVAHAISGNLPRVGSYSALSLAGSRPAVPQ